MKLWLGVLALVWLGGCTETKGPIEAEPAEVEEPHPLLGKWQTSGVDPQLGDVTVCFRFAAAGSLEVIVRAVGGLELRFPGTWLVAEEMLVLSGDYFQPEGESRAFYQIIEGGVLLLSNSAGQQEWHKQLE